jgi:hypothetical protein
MPYKTIGYDFLSIGMISADLAGDLLLSTKAVSNTHRFL